jgi:choline kinase
LTDDRPKAMVELGGAPIAERALRTLRDAGVDEVIAVTGFAPEAMDPVAALVTEQRFNERFAQTENIYSLWCARDVVEGGCYIVNSDVVFERAIARCLVDLGDTAVLCGADRVDEESMKAVSRDGRLVRLSKEVPVDMNPEYIGLTRVGPAQGPALARILERIVDQGELGVYYEAALEALAREEPVRVASVNGLAWIEIDDHDDLERARAGIGELTR